MKSRPLNQTSAHTVARGRAMAARVGDNIGSVTGQKTLVMRGGDTSDIIDTITNIYNDSWQQVRPIAERLRGNSSEETLRNVFALVRVNVRYVEDPAGVQLPKTPARTWADKTGDCKSYSLLIASLLRALGIRHAFRFVSYGPLRPYTHVYVIGYCCCGKQYVLDACMADFNQESRYHHKKDLMTDIYRLSGIGTDTDFDAAEIAAEIGALQAAGPGDPATMGAVEYLQDVRDSAGDEVMLDAIEALAEAGAYDYADFGIGRRCRPGGPLCSQYRTARGITIRNLMRMRKRGQNLNTATARTVLAQSVAAAPVDVQKEMRRVLAYVPFQDYFDMGIGGVSAIGNRRRAARKAVKAAKKTKRQEVRKARKAAPKGQKRQAAKQVRQTQRKVVQAAKQQRRVVRKEVRQERKDAGKGLFRKLARAGKKAALAPQRNAYLGLVALNVRHWASKLQRADQAGLRRKWESLGGKFGALQKAIASGARKKGLLGIDDSPEIMVMGVGRAPYIGDGGASGAAAAIAAAAPIITALAPILKSITAKQGEPTEDGTVPTLSEAVQSAAGQAWQAVQDLGIAEPQTQDQVQQAVQQGSQSLGEDSEAAMQRFETQVETENTQAPTTGTGGGINLQTLLLIGGGIAATALLAGKGKRK
jgi:hypothetical protein